MDFSVLTIFIASLALITSIWNAHSTRKHNRLSVKPNLTVHHDITSKRLIFSLENNGVGPAIIKSFKLLSDEIEIDCVSGSSYDAALEHIGCNLVHERYFPSIKEFVPAQKEIQLLKTLAEQENDLDFKLNKIVQNLRFKIVYTSIYEDEDFEYVGNA